MKWIMFCLVFSGMVFFILVKSCPSNEVIETKKAENKVLNEKIDRLKKIKSAIK